MVQKSFDQYKSPISEYQAKEAVGEILKSSYNVYNVVNLKKAFSYIDLTSLNATDNESNIKKLCEKINNFHKFPRYVGIPNVAAICVFPSQIKTVTNNLHSRYVKIASAAGGFPASQTFIKIKVAEAKSCIEAGANELDVVLSVGSFLNGDHQSVFNELVAIRNYSQDVILKVILETGALESPKNIKYASILAMEAGADFIKTSTGKGYPPATKEAVFVMAMAAKEFFSKTGKKIGIKPAGGIKTGKQATEFMAIVEAVLGNEWMTPDLFRIGASSLANNLLAEIFKLQTDKHIKVDYF
jgi:deoxyribose-phosphate aldolase